MKNPVLSIISTATLLFTTPALSNETDYPVDVVESYTIEATAGRAPGQRVLSDKNFATRVFDTEKGRWFFNIATDDFLDGLHRFARNFPDLGVAMRELELIYSARAAELVIAKESEEPGTQCWVLDSSETFSFHLPLEHHMQARGDDRLEVTTYKVGEFDTHVDRGDLARLLSSPDREFQGVASVKAKQLLRASLRAAGERIAAVHTREAYEASVLYTMRRTLELEHNVEISGNVFLAPSRGLPLEVGLTGAVRCYR